MFLLYCFQLDDDAMSGAESTVPKKSNQRTVGNLISAMLLSLTIHLLTPPSLCTAMSHQSCTYTVIPCQSCPCTVIPSQPCPCKLAPIESATCHTSKTPKLVFNPETRQGFSLNNQLILTLILYVLSK